jgi:hypothetical protein
LAAAAFPYFSHAQSVSPDRPLLDVPYLPQSEALCGGAAIAMVMRYWGATAIYAETFAELVDAEAGGIRGRDLIGALEARGFETASFEGDAARIRSALDARRPPIALIEDRPGRFHYVVIVGWRDDRVIVHDPARAPFRVIAPDSFMRAWSASRYWTLLAQPRRGLPAVPEPPLTRAEIAPADARADGVCAGLVDEGIRLAGSGDLAAAERVLQLAAADCDRDAGPWREMAGVHALRGDWPEAARDARRALDRDPHDQHSARILATSLFLAGDDGAALDAWNRIGAPVVDLVEIGGLGRTRFAVAAAALDLPPQTLLTRATLARARRRLHALPSVIGSRVTYEPGEDDRARVSASILERPLAPTGLIPLAASVLRAVTDREIGLSLASPSGGGELWTASWRWWERRPRAAFGVAAPSPFGGVWSLEAFGDDQTYGLPGSEIQERRRGATLMASDWVTGTLKLEAGASFERWDAGSTTSLHGGLERVFGEGLGSAVFSGTMMLGARRSALAAASGEWRSALAREGPVWHARAGLGVAGAQAPLALLPGAGTGHGRHALLRAHPLLDDGVVRGVFGRGLADAGIEWRYWMAPVFRTVRLAPAVFLDAARAFRTPAYGDRRFHSDLGAGLRLAIPAAGVLRIDLARGLRDGEMALSVGWERGK